MCAFTSRFLSHPGTPLEKHLEEVARASKAIMGETAFKSGRLAYYAGLLHDIGKLNPFYQELFSAMVEGRPVLESELESKYERQHSIFSAWAAEKLLCEELGYNELQIVLCAIAAHHSRLKNEISPGSSSERAILTKKKVLENMSEFRQSMSSNPSFASLGWEQCLAEYGRPISFESKLESQSGDTVRDFVEAEMVFSSLLQADRGSFSHSLPARCDLHLNTEKLVNTGSPLSSLRTDFQQWFAGVHTFEPVTVLNAPTGMGKTKVFLDLINDYVKLGAERIMYFSPLLALTDDFESKIARTLPPEKQKDILVYNHLYAGNLAGKRNAEEDSLPVEGLGYNYDNEAFNAKFVISTTQRLLMILYFNSVSDKIKLASLRNSLLIIDEIQVVPKFLLPNLVAMLQAMCREMNAKVLLVSATIPYELTCRLSIQRTPAALSEEYHRLTMKKIKFVKKLKIPSKKGKKVLVMANTRRKARDIFRTASGKSDADLFYVTSGVQKKKRIEIIRQIGASLAGKGMTVVSTQVLEAGVDVSFGEVYREAAPLDSIVQVMGRLNREGRDEDPLLCVFQEDVDHRPYSELEYSESVKVLRSVHNSRQLYERLDKYYQVVSESNMRNVDRAEELERLISDMDFQGVSDFVNSHVFDNKEEHAMIIPEDEEELARIAADLKSNPKIDQKTFRKYSSLSAGLPGSPYKLDVAKYLDPELLDRGILLPLPGTLQDVYDSQIGLDKWIK